MPAIDWPTLTPALWTMLKVALAADAVIIIALVLMFRKTGK